VQSAPGHRYRKRQTGLPATWFTSLRRRGPYLPDHPQPSVYDLSHHRCRGVRHCCGHATGDPGAIGRAARKGAVIKGGIYLEALGQLKIVFLDKTGTLTYGTPLVSATQSAPGISQRTLVEAAATVERNSEHPLGRAIIRFAEQHGIHAADPEFFEYRVGRGVLASLRGSAIVAGNRALFEELGIAHPERKIDGKDAGTEVLVARGGHYCGSLWVTDQLRPSAAPAVRALGEMDIKVVLLTGDSKAVAEAVADQLGIIEVYSELLPQQKTTFIAEQVQKRSNGGHVGRWHQ
jgi:Cu+-exporting ATPase